MSAKKGEEKVWLSGLMLIRDKGGIQNDYFVTKSLVQYFKQNIYVKSDLSEIYNC